MKMSSKDNDEKNAVRVVMRIKDKNCDTNKANEQPEKITTINK